MAITYIYLTIVIVIIYFFVVFWRRKQFLHNYQKKCVFITGTDTGFGRAVALSLDKKGVKVYAGCYSEDGLQSLEKETSDRMKCIKIDVTDEKSLLAAKEYIEVDLAANNQGLWGLVNNAGITSATLFYLATLDDYKECMDVNFFGQIRTTEIFLPLIKKSHGRIVNMLSIGRLIPIIAEPYTCSKVAMAVYNDGLRRIMKDYGIYVAGIDPGIFSTNINNADLVKENLERSWKKLPEHLKKEYGENFLSVAKGSLKAVDKLFFVQFNHISIVTDAITHALFARYPKFNYICGIDANLLFRFGKFMPNVLLDFMARRISSEIITALQLNLKNK